MQYLDTLISQRLTIGLVGQQVVSGEGDFAAELNQYPEQAKGAQRPRILIWREHTRLHPQDTDLCPAITFSLWGNPIGRVIRQLTPPLRHKT